MTDLVPAAATRPLPVASPTLGTETPDLETLFVFARDAEQRFESLRMMIDETSVTARGETVVQHEVLVQHPGRARVTSSHSADPLSDDYDIWITDGDTVRTYAARHRIWSERARPPRLVGAEDQRLPTYARSREPRTPLPAGSVADAFVHPHGTFRNVLVTGPLSVLGTRSTAGRETIVVRAEHPRSAKVLVDRPDRSLEIGIDRASGLLMTLTERIGDVVTHHVEVTSLELDAEISSTAFELHLSSDVRKIY